MKYLQTCIHFLAPFNPKSDTLPPYQGQGVVNGNTLLQFNSSADIARKWKYANSSLREEYETRGVVLKKEVGGGRLKQDLDKDF